MFIEKTMATFAVTMSDSQNLVKGIPAHIQKTSIWLKAESQAFTLRIIRIQAHFPQSFFF